MKNVLFVGPLPPPVHGQSIATKTVLDTLRAVSVSVSVTNTSEGSGSSASRLARKLLGNAIAVASAIGPTPGNMYLSANSGHGIWLSVAVAGAARLRGRLVVVHHHSYDSLRRTRRLRALDRAMGRDGIHIALNSRMAQALSENVGPARVVELENAGLIAPIEPATSAGSYGQLRLGHLSNLSPEKGLRECIELAVALKRSGIAVTLTIAGPANTAEASGLLERGTLELGDAMEYRGPVYGEQKTAFFHAIDVFLFPSRYKNEAAPLVVYESLSAGVPVIANDIGAISGILGPEMGLVRQDANFVDSARNMLTQDYDRIVSRSAARLRFEALRQRYARQLEELVQRLAT